MLFDMCAVCDVDESKLCDVCALGARRLPASKPNLTWVSLFIGPWVSPVPLANIRCGCGDVDSDRLLFRSHFKKGIGSTLSFLSNN